MSLEADSRTKGEAGFAGCGSGNAGQSASLNTTDSASAGLAECVRSLVSDYSLEVMHSIADKAIANGHALRLKMPLYVPYIPGSAYRPVIAAVRNLAGAGYTPVPHLSARSLKSRDDLKDRLHRLFDAGARDLLLIAGDQSRPDGPFSNTLGVLASGYLVEAGFQRIGVAGHPEGHPQASAAELASALREKEAYAASTGTEVRLVSQFALAAEPIVDWYRALRAGGHTLPVRIGVPGPVAASTLLKFAIQCGVGNSARFLARKPGFLRTVTRPWTPDDILIAIAETFPNDAGTPALGIHVFAFGGVERSFRWFNAVARGDFQLAAGQGGFGITA